MQSTSCEMQCWMKHKLESRLLGEIPIISDTEMTPPYGRKWRGTKEPLDENERREWKSRFKSKHSKNIQKTKIMASGPITSWQIHGETVKTVRDFLFLGSKITADTDCSHEIKRCLLLVIVAPFYKSGFVFFFFILSTNYFIIPIAISVDVFGRGYSVNNFPFFSQMPRFWTQSQGEEWGEGFVFAF